MSRRRPSSVARRVGDLLAYAVVRGLYAALAALPRGVALRVGAGLGWLAYVLGRPLRRVGLRNLALAFPGLPEAERRRILRRSFQNLGRMAGEICHFRRLTPTSVLRYVQIEPAERWREALEHRDGRGIVVLTAHLGNWELLAHAQGLLGHPVTLVHRPIANPYIDAFVGRLRARAGTRALHKKAAAREAVEVLRRGGILAVPTDQNQTRRYGVFVPFFGVEAATSPGVARLARLTGARVHPVFLVREGRGGRHRMLVLPELELVRTGDRRADTIENTRRCAAVVEAMIRRYPDQWIWFHKRWRTRPPGAPRIY